MARFAVRRVPFGRPALDDDDNGEGLPTPARIKLLARRAAGLAEAKQVLDHLPGPGESLHAVITARLDLTDVINALLDKLGRCDCMAVATLGFNRKNLRMMLGWLDSGAVASLTLNASFFFRSHQGALWSETLAEFRKRGQRAAVAASHAKVAALSFADGTRLAIEGSSNLCASGSSREQIAVINDPELTAWHSQWISDLVTRHEGDENASPGQG